MESLAAAHGSLVAASGARLWRSADGGQSWKPLAPPPGAAAPMAVAGRSDAVLLAAGGRVWIWSQ